MNKSFSQMSISRGQSKKNKTSEKRKSGNKTQRDPVPDRSKSTLLPRYLTTSDKAFKHMLATATTDGYQITPWLDTTEKLRSARQLANTVNTLKYMKLQQQLWQEYDYVAVIQEGCTSRITKTNAKAHNTCPSFGRLLKVIQQRRKNYRPSIETNRK